MTSTRQQLLTYLKETPPRLGWSRCELCDSRRLLTVANRDRYGLPLRFVMCRRCGLLVLSPRWDQAAYATFYTDYYHPLLLESGIHIAFDNWQERFDKMVGATGLHAALPPAPRVLEIGGGKGDLAAYIQGQYGAEVVIVEPNGREAQEAARRGFEVHPRVFEECCLPEASFDLVVLMRTVDHLIDASLTFRLIRQLLKPGGKVLLDGVDYFRRMAYRGDAVAPLKIDHCYYFSPETLPALMQRCGLQPLVTDVVAVPGQIIVLAEAGEGEPDEAPWVGGEARYLEWERLANRPQAAPPPLARTARWLGSRLRRLNGRRAGG